MLLLFPLVGRPMEVRAAIFPAWIEGLGASNSCQISAMTKTEGARDGVMKAS